MKYQKLSKKKIFPFFITVLLLISPLFPNKALIHAQQPSNNNQVPSDLALDLNLAQQDPAPDQQQIIKSETKEAQITTTTGESSIITPEDITVPEVKTEPQEDAIHPEETTSEQVITKPEEVNADENGTPVPTNGEQGQDVNGNQPTGIQSENGTTGEPTETQNLVPDTDVSQPDDNAAPLDNSENPNLPAPTQASDNSQLDQQNISPTEQQNDNSQQNTVPLESQPQDNSTNNQEQPTVAPSDSSSQDQPQPSSDTSSGDNSTVQGASTGPNPIVVFFQNIMHRLFNTK